MIAAVVRCDNCGAPLGVRAPHCAYCHAPQHWDRRGLDIVRGERVLAIDCTRDATPLRTYTHDTIETERVAPSRHGVDRTFEVTEGCVGIFGPALRDAVAIVEGEAVDAGGAFGALHRAQDFGATTLAYAFTVFPARRAFAFHKRLMSFEHLHEEAIVAWRAHAAVRPPGERNRVELRAADSLFVGLVNDVPVLRIETAHLGFGAPGFHAACVRGSRGQVRLWSLALHRAG